MTRILIIEDEASFSDAVSFMLEKEGFDVHVEATGPAGIAAFEQRGADLILLDLMLPGMPGTDVCKTIRAKSSVPVIMLTAKDSEIDKVLGLEMGADDYITKPFSMRELVARVRAVLRRPQGVDPAEDRATIAAGRLRQGHDVDVAAERLGDRQLPDEVAHAEAVARDEQHRAFRHRVHRRDPRPLALRVRRGRRMRGTRVRRRRSRAAVADGVPCLLLPRSPTHASRCPGGHA